MIPFVQARHCGPIRSTDLVRLIVIHTMEAPEKPTTARAVANWFAGPTAPQASAHYCVDATDTIQCVADDVVAWGAPGANRVGIHIEHAGYASQGAAGWADEYSQQMLIRSALLVADLSIRYGIPLERRTVAELADPMAKGLCGHVDITNARNGGKGHTDPGPDFPWDEFLRMVADAQRATDPDLVAVSDEDAGEPS